VIGPEPTETLELDSLRVPAGYSRLTDEVAALRGRAVLSVHDHLTLVKLPAQEGLQRLEPRVATNLGIREAQFRQALCLDEQGLPAADVFLGFFRGTMYLFASGLERSAMCTALGVPEDAMIHEDAVVLGIDGPFAWELLAEWDTPGAIGLPYLGAYSPRDGLLVIRAGRTGEYGYMVVAPRSQADEVLDELQVAGRSLQARMVGAQALRHCSLENWVFDIHRDGRAGLDALELQLTWRLDLNKRAVGLDAIRTRRAQGLRRRITAISASEEAAVGAAVTLEGRPIGSVLACVPDLFGERWRVLAVLDLAWAQPGVEGLLVDGCPGHTHSSPWVLNISLFVNPQKHTWSTRDEVQLPDGLPWPPSTS